MKRILTIFTMVLTVSVFAQAQNVTGKVTDQSGVPLTGASIAVKGTTIGTIADADGNYSLDVSSAGATLVFSYVGYVSQEIPIAGQTSIDVTLAEDLTELEQVVVIGYGSRTKATVTGSVASFSGEEMLKSHAANITTGLAGQIPGLVISQGDGRPGAEDVNILVRGKATMSGSNAPLMILDGVPTSVNDLARLNPNDIENISVLKDASAAIYGVNAANGVILVTTKRGKEGATVYSVTSTVSFTQPTRKPDWTNSYQTAVAMNEEKIYSGGTAIYDDVALEKLRTGSSPLTHAGPDVDWYDQTFKNWAPQQRHAITANGGTEKVQYFLSGELLHQDGNYKIYEEDNSEPAVYYNQYQLRSNLDFQATDRLKVSLDLAARVKDRSQEQSTNAARLRAKQALPETIFRYDNGMVGTMQYGLNPVILGSTVAGYNKVYDNSLTGILRYDYQLDWITEGLSLEGFAKYGIGSGKTTNWLNTWYTYKYDENLDDYLPSASGWTTNYPRLNKSYRDNHSSQVDTKLNYSRTFGDHNLNVFVGMEVRQGFNENMSASRGDYLSNQLEILNAGDELTDTNGGSMSETSALHYFGRFFYGYKDKYMVDFTLRADGSYKFPEGQKWGTFPAVAAAWRISEESFFADNIGFINYAKIRGSWGRLGLDNTDPFQYLATYSQVTSKWFQTYIGAGGDPVTTYESDGVPNFAITWEEQENYDAGLDLQFAGGLIDFTGDYFYNKRSKILIPRTASVPDYYGITLPDENLGIVNSYGFDGSLAVQNRKSSGFSYYAAGTFTFTRNRVEYLDEAAGVEEWQKKEGHSVDALETNDRSDASRLIFEADGLFQNQGEIDAYPHLSGAQPGDIKYIDYNEDGVIDDKDRVRTDKVQTPEIVFGLNLGANYKGFDFVVRLQGQARAWHFVQPVMLRYDKAWHEGRWQEEGDNLYPKTYAYLGDNQIGSHNNDRRSTFWLKSAAFVRVKTVELGYNLPQSVLSRANIKGLRIFVSADNLFCFDQMDISRDVEINNWQSYEILRTVTGGVTLNF